MSQEQDWLWNRSMPEIYDRFLKETIFLPHARALADRAAGVGAERVLETAAGTGVLTAELVQAMPTAQITATDLNQAMVDHGSKRVLGAVWRRADAMELPFPDAFFDLVVCQFGVMFFPDRRAAFAEVARVLQPGGRFLFNTWDVIERSPMSAAVAAGVARSFPDDPPMFLERTPHGYNDVEVITGDLHAAGLQPGDVEHLSLEGHAPTAAGIAIGFCLGSPLRFEIEARGSLDEAVNSATEELTRRLGAESLTAEMGAIIFTASRPAED
ncbi:MAG TPA: methyltransferase domain-containing protein [Actinomycetota bacterium]|nr:methyltransferase domain-containing protein [Actinomycetota bacterium]